MSVAFILLATATVVTSALSLVWMFAVRRGTGKALAKPLTLRISNIPGSTSKDEFERILADAAARIIASPGATHEPGLLGFSFAASGHSDGCFVATATFHASPSPTQLGSAIKRKSDPEWDRLRVDLDFFGLTPLTDPMDPSVDIIAVTGLAGHAFGSWKSREGQQMWLRDFLPNALKTARIWTYGYDTKLPGSQSSASILELAKKLLESVKTIRNQQNRHRPIIFIGHSLGGLVVKQALVEAADGSQDDRAVFMSCYAVIFFGVPNRGLEISSLASMVKGQPNEQLVRDLDPNSRFLTHLHDMFYRRFTFDDSPIISIYETKTTPTVEWSMKKGTWERTGKRVMMVPQNSAIHAGKNEKSYDQLFIDGDHSNIVKFNNPSDPDYRIIESRMKRLMDDGPQVIRERTAGDRKRLSDMELEYLKALDAPKYAAFREFNVEDPAPGTLKWFLHDELVSSWISKEESSSLWIRGSPGQGKTVLSKFILDHVEKLAESYRSVKVIYFFFSDRDECFRTASSLLRSLLKQLLATSDLFRHVSDIVRTDSSTDSEDSLWEVLEATFHAPTFSKIYCIIDALDECDEGSRGWLLRRIAKLAQVSAQKQGRVLKLFVTSRPVVDIARKLNSFPCINLRANPSDLKLLIDSRVATLGNFGAELQEYAAQLLLSRAGRTFLWVSIVLRQLSKISLPSKAEVRRIIETSPTDLDELYRTIIDRIMKGNPSQQKLLVWVVYGQRPLTLEELKAALATQIDSRNKASTEEYQISLSAKTIAEDAGVILEITHGKVHLIHQSAKDFLIKNGQLKSASFCNNQDPSIYLAKVCIAYLSFEDFETGPCHDEQALAIRKRQYPLFHYAARNWHAHVPKNGVDAVAHMLDRLIKPQSPILLSWGEAAGIPDIRQATDEIGVAGKTNIDWLADFHSSNVIITKAKVMEAAKNWSTGFEMMKKFANSGDVQFDEGALRALISCFGTDMMQHLLNKGHQFDVTHDLIKEIIANRMTGKFVMRAILHQWNDAVLTAELVKSAAEDSESGKDILEMLLRKQDINITEEAFAAIIRHFDAQLLSSVPDGKRDIKVTEKVVEAAAVHEDRNEMMQQLLKRTDWEITDRAVVAIVRLFSTVGVEYLLRSDVTITQAAAESLAISCNAKVMKLLLESRKPIQFTEAFVGAAASNKFYGEQVMKLLLTRANIPITETVVRAAAVNSGSGKEVLELLLRMGDIRTMEIVAKISPVNIAPGELLSRAVENGYEVLARQLLDRRGTDANSKDCEGWTPLVRAARKGDIGLVETLLHAKADVNVAITCGHRPTALEAAAEDGHLDVVERLLAAGADVNAAAARRHGRTALQAAAGGGYSDVVERLLAAGADANAAAARRHGRSALQGAAGGGHLGVVERLLAAGADVNAGPAEQYGRTALQAAAGGGHLDVVERLLAAGAGVNAAVEAYGRIALQLAAEGGHFDVVERLLVAGAEVNVTYGRTALQAAAEGGHLNVVERLLAAGAGVNVVAKYSDWAALRAAAGGGHLDVVERLLAAGADVNAASIYEGWTALQAAAGGGYLDVVERLLAARADANTTADGNMVGQSLQAAAGVGHLNALEKLLVAEADVNPTPEYVQTALQAAAGGGHLDIVERLLAAGADVNTTAIFGNQTALQEAAGGGHLDVVERLLAAGADVNTTAIFSNQTALQEAAGGGHLDVVERLLAAGADVNATATFGNQRALQEAARGGHLDVVERLLAAEADVNATAGYGDLTALQEAAGGGHLDVVERLLAAGANVNVVGIFFEGRTTLQAAAGGGYLDVVERLLAAGADVNAAAARKHGRTALQAAAGGGHLNVVERLLADQADVNADAAEEYGRTALQAAAGGGYLDVVERLLAAGADVNAAAAEKHGRTALQAAAGGGHLDAVERLRQAGAT